MTWSTSSQSSSGDGRRRSTPSGRSAYPGRTSAARIAGPPILPRELQATSSPKIEKPAKKQRGAGAKGRSSSRRQDGSKSPR